MVNSYIESILTLPETNTILLTTTSRHTSLPRMPQIRLRIIPMEDIRTHPAGMEVSQPFGTQSARGWCFARTARELLSWALATGTGSWGLAGLSGGGSLCRVHGATGGSFGYSTGGDFVW